MLIINLDLKFVMASKFNNILMFTLNKTSILSSIENFNIF
jgi:hypothetical protein